MTDSATTRPPSSTRPADGSAGTPIFSPLRFWLCAVIGVLLIAVATFVALDSHSWLSLPLAFVGLVVVSLGQRHPRLPSVWLLVPMAGVVTTCIALLRT